jgi:hypothetical protein
MSQPETRATARDSGRRACWTPHPGRGHVPNQVQREATKVSQSRLGLTYPGCAGNRRDHHRAAGGDALAQQVGQCRQLARPAGEVRHRRGQLLGHQRRGDLTPGGGLGQLRVHIRDPLDQEAQVEVGVPATQWDVLAVTQLSEVIRQLRLGREGVTPSVSTRITRRPWANTCTISGRSQSVESSMWR